MLRQMTSIGYRRAALFARRPPLSCVGPHGAVQRGTTSTQRSMCCSVGKSREFPTEPRVAIGITVFRQWESKLQVLLIKRGKEPNKGEWCFPGGSVELGEKIADCAAREVQEETGLAVFNQGGRSPTSCPTTYDAADIIWKQDDGNMRFHYVVVEMAAVVKDPKQKPEASDDADAAEWFDVSALESLPNLVKDCDWLTAKAANMFQLHDKDIHAQQS